MAVGKYGNVIFFKGVILSDKPKFYIDYPQEKIDPSTNNYRCIYCKVSTLEINGLLNKHKVDCEYKISMESKNS